MSSLPLPEHGKFCDLNVPFENVAAAGKKLAMLVQLGYEVVAFSRFLDSTAKTTKKKKYEIPSPPPKVPLTSEMLQYFKNHNSSLMQFTRLTIELKHVDDLLKVREALFMDTYDIIAVVPSNEQLLMQSCTELNIDIISLDCTSSFTFIPSYKLLTSAAKRGICFEINYSPMIRDASTRNCTVANAQRLSRVRKFSNLILSSACLNPMELRGPYDVANLNCLFAIPESSYIHTISKHCRAAIVHGFIRKTAKGAVYVEEMNKTEQNKAEKQLNSALQASKDKAGTTVVIAGSNVLSQDDIVEVTQPKVKTKKVAKKGKTAKKSSKTSPKSKKAKAVNDCLQSVNILNEIESVTVSDSTKKSNEKKIKKKNLAKANTPEKGANRENVEIASDKKSKLTKKKTSKKRKLEEKSDESCNKKILLAEE